MREQSEISLNDLILSYQGLKQESMVDLNRPCR